MICITTHSPEETEAAAAQMAQKLRGGDIIALRGPLGAGKTAFTRGLAHGLDIPQAVSSPTFSLVHEYRGGRLTLYHFDMYRVTDFDSLYSTGFFDYLEDPQAVLAIEWSENIEQALTMPHITVQLAPADPQSRELTIAGDERF